MPFGIKPVVSANHCKLAQAIPTTFEQFSSQAQWREIGTDF